jgi:hypothetical protein
MDRWEFTYVNLYRDSSTCGWLGSQLSDTGGVPSATMQSNISKAGRALAPHGMKAIIEGGPHVGCYHVRIVTIDGDEPRGVVHDLMYEYADLAAAAWPDTGDIAWPYCSRLECRTESTPDGADGGSAP